MTNRSTDQLKLHSDDPMRPHYANAARPPFGLTAAIILRRVWGKRVSHDGSLKCDGLESPL